MSHTISPNMTNVGVVIPARNESNHISQTLLHLVNQTLPPSQVIVVNDGSTDNTKELAEWFYPVVDFPIKHENWVAHKNLARVFNYGLHQLNTDKLDYIMILGADHILPSNYIETITERMSKPVYHKDGTTAIMAIASGAIKDEYANVPRGSGRIIDKPFWQSIGLFYPVNWGFETYLLIKAWQLGKNVAYYSDVITTTQRKTSINFNPEFYNHYGKALKALGYTKISVLARSAMMGKRKPIFALKMIQGYLSGKDVDNYEPELRQFVKRKQYRHMKDATNYQGLKAIKTRLVAH